MESGSESEGGATFKLLWKRSLEKVKTKQIVDHLVDEAKKSSRSVLDPAPAGSEEAEKDAKKQKTTAAAGRFPFCLPWSPRRESATLTTPTGAVSRHESGCDACDHDGERYHAEPASVQQPH